MLLSIIHTHQIININIYIYVFREKVMYEIQHGRVPVITFLVNKVVTRSSVSEMRSSMTMRFLVAESNMLVFGNPSSNLIVA